MTKITHDDVLKLAKLARLSLNDDEIDRYAGEITAILSYVDMLQSVVTDGLRPTYQVTGLVNVTRSDTVTDYGTTKTALLSNAPDTENGQFKVKRMVG